MSGPAQDTDSKGPSQATRLVQLADELIDVVAGADGRAYAVKRSGPNIAFPLRGANGLRVQLAHHYAQTHGGAPSQSALTDALTVLEGRVLDLDPHPVHLRLASWRGPAGDSVVLDLGAADGRCVIATPHGWRVAGSSPVLFRRTRLTSPLPAPGAAGATEQGLDALRGLLNVNEPTFRVIVGWLVAGLMPDLPHPILAAQGEQGTGKSTALAMLINLIDPSPAPLRSLPRDIKTWATIANASWAVCLDNVSTIAPWLSDTLCKAVTGDGFVDRSLYTDDDVSVLAFRRLLAMTSIDTGALASDLAERLLTAEFQPIKGEQRRTDAELQAAYAQAAPAILAALLDLLCQVLKALPSTKLASLPRMADFARVLGALDSVTGWSTLDSYLAAAEVNTADLIDAKPFAGAVAAFAEQAGTWTGTIGQLLELVAVPDPRPKSWPGDATRAAGQLKRDAPVLRAIGVTVEEAGRTPDRHRRRLYRLTAAASQCPHAEDGAEAPMTSPDALFGGTGESGKRADAGDSVSAPASTQNPRSNTPADTADAADTAAVPLSNARRPAPVEAGTCLSCGSDFTRYRATRHRSYCTPCATGQRQLAGAGSGRGA